MRNYYNLHALQTDMADVCEECSDCSDNISGNNSSLYAESIAGLGQAMEKSWKVMEFMISISRPGKSWNSSEGHLKSWKSNMLSENEKTKR